VPRNSFIAQLINKIARLWWWSTRPQTKGVKILLVHQSNILLVRLTYYPNTWTFPGGGVRKGETLESAVRRECIEEVGIEPTVLRLLNTLDFEHEYKKDEVAVFLSELENNITPTIDGKEIAEAKWFSLDGLPKMGKNAKKILKLYFSQR